MTLSVVIPTCHRNESLARALEALSPSVQQLAQGQYEIIVSDDGNRSTAEAMIKNQFPWARWIQGPSRGPAANRNHGARTASAEWLVFTDDDCVPEPGWLAAYGRAIASGSASVYEGRTYTEVNRKGPFWGAPANETGGLLWSCNLAIRAEVFFSIGGFDDRFPYPHLEDVDFRERLKAAGHDFQFCPEAAVFHPLRPVTSAVRQAMGHESYFYYARKHGLSLKKSGLSLYSYMKARWMWMESSRGIADRMRFIGRSAIEGFLVAVLSPWWWLKFRTLKKCADGEWA